MRLRDSLDVFTQPSQLALRGAEVATGRQESG
jgi:hypothetical protein